MTVQAKVKSMYCEFIIYGEVNVWEIQHKGLEGKMEVHFCEGSYATHEVIYDLNVDYDS